MKIKAILTGEEHALLHKQVTIHGWIRSVRAQKNFSFLEVNDGSCLANLQVIVDQDFPSPNLLSQITTGTSVVIQGEVVKSPAAKQQFELKALHIEILGSCPAEEYPLQKKRHSHEFLRTIAHLRPRTNTQGAVMRVRNRLAFATHQFFQERGYLYIHTPLITTSDCEGAGEQFHVSKLNLQNPPKNPDGTVDFSQDFFGKPTFLTVSGQLNAEAYASALSHVYTFGPTFRSENSNTSRHLAEFWMIEPEAAFTDLAGIQKLAVDFVKFVFQKVLTDCHEDIQFFNQFIDPGVLERLNHVVSSPFAHFTYTEAIAILKKSGRTFVFPVEWGLNLQSEHERYLAEEHCKCPVILTDYPRDIKAFYMRDNDDGKTVAAMDLLVPKIGEIIGGSQREERYNRLLEKITNHGLHLSDYQWYLDLRKYGTVPHAGFGAGFERLVLFATGMENIRDVIPFPRVPGNADF